MSDVTAGPGPAASALEELVVAEAFARAAAARCLLCGALLPGADVPDGELMWATCDTHGGETIRWMRKAAPARVNVGVYLHPYSFTRAGDVAVAKAVMTYRTWHRYRGDRR